MRFIFWLSLRLLKTKGGVSFSISNWISVVGLAIGVSALVVSMAVMSGFETTLIRSVADVTGHVQVLVRGAVGKKSSIPDEIREVTPSIEALSPFLLVEGVLAHDGKLRGVFLQGVEPATVGKVLGFDGRLVDGEVNFAEASEEDLAIIGKGIARDFSLKVGDKFRVVMPIADELNPNKFSRSLGVFTVHGIMDLGKYDYDQRMIFTTLNAAQTLAAVDDGISGYILRYPDYRQAREHSTALSSALGASARVRDWNEVNQNLFEAVKIEKAVVFFVILVIVIAAAFSSASALYINVIRKFADISTLKSLGLSPRKVMWVFSIQGLMVGAVGLFLGLLLGMILIYALEWAQLYFSFVPGSIYTLDRIILDVRSFDIFLISSVTLIICFISTLAPAYRGANLNPVEGLRQ